MRCFGFTLAAYGAGLALIIAALPSSVLAAPDQLVGIWGMKMSYQPGAHGTLLVKRQGASWRATIGADSVNFVPDGNRIRFGFPKDRGSFRGLLTETGTIDGFWVQPIGDTRDPRDPGLLGQGFASPLALEQTDPRTWRAMVRPLADEFTLYLRVFRGPDGSLVGAFRNPENNSRGGANQFRVVQTGDNVTFAAQPDPSEPEIRLAATYERSPDRIKLAWPDLNRSIELVRLTDTQAAAFFPRPPSDSPYAYHRPSEIGDGWQTARASDVGMDEGTLARLVQQISTSDPSVGRPQLIHSLLVARHGKLVLEEYFFGFDRNQVHDLRSAGKTYASVMAGAAMMNGVDLMPDTPVYSLLAGMGPFSNPDPRKEHITVGQLMTHTSGLACDDNDDASPGNESTMQAQTKQPNWWKYTLDLPMAHDPGTRYAYCSANINLVGAAITTATNTWLPEYFDRTIARPLQFERYYWNLMPTNEGYLGGGAYVRPRDFLKLGQAFLNGGTWNGKRIVDASWVAQSTAPHVTIDEASTGLSVDQFSNFYLHGQDGYAWHLGVLTAGQRTYREYGASGNGGQLLVVIPDLDTVISFTAGNYGQGGIWLKFRDQIIPNQIVPAIVR